MARIARSPFGFEVVGLFEFQAILCRLACADRCQPLTERRMFAEDGTPLTLAATPELSDAMAALQDAGERHATCTVRIKYDHGDGTGTFQ
jgi:hypothetical protein